MPLVVFTNAQSTSSRTAIQYLTEHGINFTERKVNKEPMTYNEFLEIVQSKNFLGIENIITRSKSIKSLGIEDMTVRKVYEAIQNNSNILRYPILFDGEKLMAGFIKGEMGLFTPRSHRRKELNRLLALCDAGREQEIC